MKRALVRFAVLFYCIGLLLAFDFVYSSFIRGDERERSPRVPNAIYHHGLAPNFDGYDHWGELRYPLRTNSLGFRDAAVRDVPATSTSRRVLLMGDSFTEGLGVTFEDSFAGMLYRAGHERGEQIEFLNGAALSYSPTVYYRKIKYLLESGLHFDEVVVFSDLSDVQDEAITYFCIDDDPKYKVHCIPDETPSWAKPRSKYLESHFTVTDRTRVLIKHMIQSLLGNQKRDQMSKHDRIGWVFPGFDVGDKYRPLGVDGGIARSLENMRALADLLSRHAIPLSIVVYPWPSVLAQNDRDSRQVAMWREFCRDRCKEFINLFPAFFAEKDANPDWYERLYIFGDYHFSPAGHRFVFRELAKHLL